MPIKKNTNKLSQLYKTIDQKELSKEALDALSKLRLATGNFRKQEGKEVDAFKLFFDRLVKNKPTAVKTTPEYKAMIKERRSENGRKAMEARKAKQESRQGQGSEEDAKRPAKPFGWRLKGKHNYRKPTRADISSGKAYYEARINRADSKRTKFPMLERGGFMADGGAIKNQYEGREAEDIWNNLTRVQRNHFLVDHEDDLKLKEDAMSTKDYFETRDALARLKFSELKKNIQDEFAVHTFMGQYADGGFMADGGEITYAVVDENTDRIYVKSKNEKFIKLKYNELKEVYPTDKLSIVEFNSGMMAKGGQVDVVLNEGNGKIINKLYNEWNNVKTEKEYKEWVDKVRSTKFGTYGTLTYDEVLKNFDFDNAPINSYHLKTFKAELKNALNKGYEYADGGFMAKGGRIKEEGDELLGYEPYFEKNVAIASIDRENKIVRPRHGYYPNHPMSKKAINWAKNNGYDYIADGKKYADGGFMEHGGDVDKGGMIYALREFVSSGEIANKTDVLNYDDIAKIRRIAIQYYMDNGDVPYSYGELAKVLSYANDKFKSGMMAKGGMTEHNLMIGDTIKQSFRNVVVVENDGKTYVVNINTGQRWSDSEWWNLSKGDTTKYTKMAKGGVFYSDSHKLGHE